ncbi:isoprenylcysteine carboxylmethyltransferase family protein [Rhodoluna sp.]|uniref:methyltransferase family protein n=1 Tax=Rhodoluna sp. TaxID=1969481 RepID=UPI0025F983BA|nr:isoprenylcysteine carboxylmethyltransferase family protein [Rhodoluna sp.]
MSDKSKGNLLVLVQFALIAFVVLWPSGQINIAAIYIGGILLVAPGIIVLYLGIKNLGRSLAANPVPKSDAELVETGIYKYLRHPIYTGLMLASLGSAVQTLDLAKLVVWCALVLLLNYKARWEETLLVKKYSGYANYMKRTGRFVPRLK